MGEIKLSIIIPCYNCEKTLLESVASCFIQGFKEDEFEVILVDDCSTDETKELILKVTSENKNAFGFFHEKNQGGGATRNTAVKNSKGSIIFCLDSDDLLPPDTLIKMYTYFQEKKCDGVNFYKSTKFNGDDIKNVHHTDFSDFFDKKIPFSSLFPKHREFVPLYVNFMYTRNAFDKMGGYPTLHGCDTQGFGWRFLCAGLSAYTCPDTEYLHRINFTESYYLREYNSGKMNYSWRSILLEHYYVFNKNAIDFIYNFDCSDFTRSIMDDLINLKDVLVPNVESVFAKKHPMLQRKVSAPVYIKRNSLKGYYLRIKHRVKKVLLLC